MASDGIQDTEVMDAATRMGPPFLDPASVSSDEADFDGASVKPGVVLAPPSEHRRAPWQGDRRSAEIGE